MRQKLYGNHVQPACEICVQGHRSSDGRAVLCQRKGVVPLYHHCRKFVYDPLKRIPKRAPQMREHQENEFSLEP